MLNAFKGRGHCVTMGSTYMGDIIALISHHKWLINMVGTSNENRARAKAKRRKKEMKMGTYECVFQHRAESLCYAMWADNNIVYTLSNFHSPKILAEGPKRKRKVDRARERE